MKKTNIITTLLAALLIMVSATAVSAAETEDIEATITEGIENFQTTIDVSELGIDSKTAMASFLEIVKESPEYFFVDTAVKCSYSKNTGNATKLTVSYNETAETAGEKLAELNQKVDEVVAEVEGMTTAEQAKAVHDYLIANCSYDLTYTKRTAYDALIEGTGVCEAYSAAYKLIMTKLDIPCEIVESDAMNHAWNTIEIDGEWLHVDVTWDDPIVNESTENITPYYDYFMVSDAELADHYDWE